MKRPRRAACRCRRGRQTCGAGGAPAKVMALSGQVQTARRTTARGASPDRRIAGGWRGPGGQGPLSAQRANQRAEGSTPTLRRAVSARSFSWAGRLAVMVSRRAASVQSRAVQARSGTNSGPRAGSRRAGGPEVRHRVPIATSSTAARPARRVAIAGVQSRTQGRGWGIGHHRQGGKAQGGGKDSIEAAWPHNGLTTRREKAPVDRLPHPRARRARA